MTNTLQEDAGRIVLANTVILFGKDSAEIIYPNMVAAVSEALQSAFNAGCDAGRKQACNYVTGAMPKSYLLDKVKELPLPEYGETK